MSASPSRQEPSTPSRGNEIAQALAIVGDGLDSLTAVQWASPSLCEGWSVKDTIAHLVWRLGTPSMRLATDIVRASVAGRHANPMESLDDIARGIADSGGTDELRRELRAIADEKAQGHGRTNAGELLEVVVHGYDALHPLGIQLPFPPATTHRVATASALKAPRRVRSVIRHRTLVAEDAGWRIGHGSEIVADAASVILFLNGRKAMQPPQRERILAPAPTPGLA
ncbi:maleylpyruvate isomerase family mycothiol-dependent enzyme [Mycetocola zhujimingii]|uniref:maleylpyruvate isomerase family mycothiol-dependent enzyme n=1 Tax=Mycetocola zhujimingii TaxID=2079792 RepID=UPI000D3832CB|nr:maleylpyruvate isomerase family mycothiol-dependent enzyme [Mycetocola zhujimingii]AWB85953.1 maleylpyruvate isomerase family mycothiol-dependent enzyme [Mycetocola zhujimingii]